MKLKPNLVSSTFVRRPLRTRSIALAMAMVMVWYFDGSPLYSQEAGPAPRQPRPNGLTKTARPGAPADSIRFDEVLVEIRDSLKSGRLDASRLADLRTRLAREHAKVERHFAELEAHFQQKGLSGEIRARHEESVHAYKTKHGRLLAELDAVQAALPDAQGLRSQLDRTGAFLEESFPRKSRPRLDPKNLPFRSLRAEKPILPGLGLRLPKSNAPGGGGVAGPLGASPTPEDLAETVEVKFTPEIQKLAGDLGRSPLKIYEWVRNNIEFVPTWGSIQGAQLCLETRRGNAFDTASLLIALLRTSGIPARYQMGTIEVPADAANNWLGGFTDLSAAARFAASGGIPSAGTVERGGELRSIRMDHVWVNAFVDYFPSRGAAVCDGLDTWVALDASYKQYEYSPGVDMAAAVGLDVPSLQAHIAELTKPRDGEDSVIGHDSTFMRTAVADGVRTLEASFPGVTDFTPFLPSRRIAQTASRLLQVALPYTVLARGIQMAEIPNELRHHLVIKVLDAGDVVLLETGMPLPAVAGAQLALAYKFASDADIELARSIAADMPVNPNDPATVREFVKRLPAQSLNVRPTLRIDGAESTRGLPTRMASDQRLTVGFIAPTVTTPDLSVDLLAWGRCAITLDVADISPERIRRVASDMSSSKDDFGAVVSGAHYLMGASWFASVDRHSEVFARSIGLAFARYPSLAFSFPNVRAASSVFGVPLSVRSDAYILDAVRQLHVLAALDGDASKEVAFNLLMGIQSSYLEGTVVERLLGITDPIGNTASSALHAAAEQGMRIFALDSANLEANLPKIDDRFPKEKIRDAVNAQLVVFVPESPPSIKGVNVTGYIAIDPDTGEGAYLVGRALGEEIHCETLPSGSPSGLQGAQENCFLLLDTAEFMEDIEIILLIMLAFLLLAAAGAEVTIGFTVAEGLSVLTWGSSAYAAMKGIAAAIDSYKKCKASRILHPGIGCATPFLKAALDAIGIGAVSDLIEFF